MRPAKGTRKKPPARITIAPSMKLTVGRTEAAQMLSISIRGIDYLLASRRLTFRKLGGRVLIPVDELRKYARGDHPERIVA
jgi:excisionase family DNA binding protein